jgi:capsular polysaccharide biosynthesis protein
MKPPTHVPRVRDYLELLRDGWIVIVCATLLSVGVGWMIRESTAATYQATTRVLMVTPGGAEVVDVYYGTLAAEARALTVQQLVASPQVTKRTVDQLHLSETPGGLAGRISASFKGALVEIHVTGYDAALTRDTANAVTSNLIAVTREMALVDNAAGDLILVDDATHVAESRGSLAQFLISGAALGLVLSAVLVIARGLARDRVLTRNQVGHIATETGVGSPA